MVSAGREAQNGVSAPLVTILVPVEGCRTTTGSSSWALKIWLSPHIACSEEASWTRPASLSYHVLLRRHWTEYCSMLGQGGLAGRPPRLAGDGQAAPQRKAFPATLSPGAGRHDRCSNNTLQHGRVSARAPHLVARGFWNQLRTRHGCCIPLPLHRGARQGLSAMHRCFQKLCVCNSGARRTLFLAVLCALYHSSHPFTPHLPRSHEFPPIARRKTQAQPTRGGWSRIDRRTLRLDKRSIYEKETHCPPPHLE